MEAIGVAAEMRAGRLRRDQPSRSSRETGREDGWSVGTHQWTASIIVLTVYTSPLIAPAHTTLSGACGCGRDHAADALRRCGAELLAGALCSGPCGTADAMSWRRH